MLRIASTGRRNGAVIAAASSKRFVTSKVGEGQRVTPPPPPPVYVEEPVVKSSRVKITPPPPPKAKKEKKFSLFGFLFKTALLGLAVYGATLYAATKNDKVMDFVTEYELPYHDELLDLMETTTWDDLEHYAALAKHHLMNLQLPSQASMQELKHKLEEKSHQFTQEARRTYDTVTHKTPQEQLQLVEVEQVTRDIKRLPQVALPTTVDPAVQLTVTLLNALILLIDALNVDPKLVKIISDNVEALSAKMSGLTGTFDAAVKDKMRLLQTELLSLYTKKELDLTETLLNQYNSEKAALEAKLAAQLAHEVQATKDTISQAAVNAVTMVRINQTKEFEKLVTDKIDAERNGRLAHLEQVDERLALLEEFAQGLGGQIEANHRHSQLRRAIVSLRTLLFDYPQTAQPQLLKPAVNELIALLNELSDPLLEEALKNLIPLVGKESTHSIVSVSQLLARWQQLAPELRSASLLPPNAGLLGHLLSLLFSKLLMPVKGSHPEARDIELVIGRVEDSLTRGDLDDAVEEVANLKGWPRKLANDWVVEGRKRLEVEFLVNLIDTEARVL